MSKAFTKETDGEDDGDPGAPGPVVAVKNYITPHGHEALQSELRELVRIERPKMVEVVTWAASNGHASVSSGIVSGISQGIDTISYTISNIC